MKSLYPVTYYIYYITIIFIVKIYYNDTYIHHKHHFCRNQIYIFLTGAAAVGLKSFHSLHDRSIRVRCPAT